MNLLLVFLTSVLVGQSISIGIGLLVERHSTPYTGLVTFIVFYFVMFWAAWRFAVRVTEPRRRIRERGEPSAVLLGASAAADDLWTQSTLLL
jgi:FlaA1/EpsC-like NDP-sugar epimerase